jgi:hypothetical protein
LSGNLGVCAKSSSYWITSSEAPSVVFFTPAMAPPRSTYFPT